MLKLWRKWGERPVRAPRPPPTFQDRRKFWRVMLGLICFWQVAISALILILRLRMGGLVSSYGLFFCLAFLAIGLFAAFTAFMPKLTFMYAHALASLFIGLGYILTIVIVYGTTASSTTTDLSGLLVASFAVYLPAAFGLTLGGVASYLAWRKTRQIDFEEFAAAQFLYGDGPAPNNNNNGANAALAPLNQQRAASVSESSGDDEELGAAAAPPRANPRASRSSSEEQSSDSESDSDAESNSESKSAEKQTVVDAASASDSGAQECCVCMENPRNAVIYKCGHIAVCFECGQKLLKSGQKCPICRQKIVDVIKSYKV